MKLTRPNTIRIAYAGLLATLIVAGLLASCTLGIRHRHERHIIRASRTHGVDPRLIAAVIWMESRFNADAVGAAGELGLMQVMEPAGREWAEATGFRNFRPELLADPRINVEAGTWYLARAIRHWAQHYPSDPLPYALAEYNAGRSRVERWRTPGERDSRRFIESIPFPGTKKYVETILARYRGG